MSRYKNITIRYVEWFRLDLLLAEIITKKQTTLLSIFRSFPTRFSMTLQHVAN